MRYKKTFEQYVVEYIYETWDEREEHRKYMEWLGYEVYTEKGLGFTNKERKISDSKYMHHVGYIKKGGDK